MEPFATIGRELSERWARAELDEQQFPELAREALERARPHEQVNQRELLRWLATTEQLPPQHELGFGQPPVNLYRDDRIYIEALFWLDATTSIHQHAFSGAFCVLDGSSVHARYEFSETRRINDQLLLGELGAHDVELLRPGQVRTIRAGREFIHALFHLEHPTLSLVARTHHAPAHTVQYAYHPPGIALDPFWRPEALMRRLDALDMLLESKHPELQPFAEVLVDGACATALALALMRLNLHAHGNALIPPLLQRARARHGALVDVFSEMLQRDRARGLLAARRKALTQADLRFVLALLINVTGRDRILALIHERFPDQEPVQTLLRCLREMHRTPIDAGNALGVELDEDGFWILERLLHGAQESEIEAEAARSRPALSPSRIAQTCFMLPWNSVLGPLLRVSSS